MFDFLVGFGWVFLVGCVAWIGCWVCLRFGFGLFVL